MEILKFCVTFTDEKESSKTSIRFERTWQVSMLPQPAMSSRKHSAPEHAGGGAEMGILAHSWVPCWCRSRNLYKSLALPTVEPVTGGNPERSGELFCVSLHHQPRAHCVCLTPISLPVRFESLEIHPYEQAGHEGVRGRAGVGWVGQMWRNRTFVLVREAVKIENAL